MGISFRWTAEDDATIKANYGTLPNAELAFRLGRSMDAIKRRAVNLGIAQYEFHHDHDPTMTDLIKRNQEFIDTMAAAIRAGLERPPMVGVDTRPCGGMQSGWSERAGAYVGRAGSAGA